MLYEHILRPLLFQLPAEQAHHTAFLGLRVLESVPPLTRLNAWLFTHTSKQLHVDALGLRFPNPIGLAAGFDKDALAMRALFSMGFGFIEVGTLTAHPQPGNPLPRLFRLPADRALLNRLGFNNGGSEAAVARLQRRPLGPGVLGVNIGKSKATPEDEAASDYALSAERLAPYADYLVVNVSSPNTPGLRNLQAVEKLEPILRAVQQAIERACTRACAPRMPQLLVKIAPDLADEDIDAAAQLTNTLGLGGVVATNTTIRRDGLSTDAAFVASLGAGGISGRPLRTRSLDVLKRLRPKLDASRAIISVGGLEDAEDCWARLDAGATLLQLYTGFIYGGPRLPSQLNRSIETRLDREGKTLSSMRTR